MTHGERRRIKTVPDQLRDLAWSLENYSGTMYVGTIVRRLEDMIRQVQAESVPSALSEWVSEEIEALARERRSDVG